MCKVLRSLRKLNFKKELVFIKIFISILVIKLNVLCEFKKMLIMTSFKMDTNIRFFSMKQPSVKVKKFKEKKLPF